MSSEGVAYNLVHVNIKEKCICMVSFKVILPKLTRIKRTLNNLHGNVCPNSYLTITKIVFYFLILNSFLAFGQ